ncbi:hypothetical protein SAMN06265379_103214 [Saccharicrinis carchari]|uniref:Uncharacterized protein n=1 Tax=Saccharicrinis carchari TaxID=1168039 RepID=A0A521CK82_SACCC|nr:hypothetical protein SAMN06265379_103214 [Saccharicrinis carchari]
MNRLNLISSSFPGAVIEYKLFADAKIVQISFFPNYSRFGIAK